MTFTKYYNAISILSFLTIVGCANRFHTFDKELLAEADSLFHAGNFEYSKMRYSKVIEQVPNSPSARTAQYYLGFINIYYDNPFADWEKALNEFKMFAALYPDDFRIKEVNSWIRILVVMQSFKNDYQGATKQLDLTNERIIADSYQRTTQNKSSIDSLTIAIRGCVENRDSLSRKTRELENVILILEKKCQQAGR